MVQNLRNIITGNGAEDGKMSHTKKPEIKPVPIQPAIPGINPEINPSPEKPDKTIKPELNPDPEPKTRPGKETDNG